MNKTAAYFRLLRPFTMVPPFIVAVAGGIMAIGYYQLRLSTHIHDVLIFGAIMAAINGASNALNQVFDAEIDKINKPYRPIPSGIIEKDAALMFSFVVYATAIITAIYFNTTAAIFACVFSATTILYTVPPVRLKQKLWVSNITIAVARSWFLLLAGWCSVAVASITAPPIWYVGGILFIYLIGASATKDFTDIEGDGVHGMRTLPVVYGVRRSIMMISPFFVLPYILIPIGTTLSILPITALQLTPLIAWSFYVLLILGDSATKRDKTFENSKMWVHMYLMMMALSLGFGLTFLCA